MIGRVLWPLYLLLTQAAWLPVNPLVYASINHRNWVENLNYIRIRLMQYCKSSPAHWFYRYGSQGIQDIPLKIWFRGCGRKLTINMLHKSPALLNKAHFTVKLWVEYHTVATWFNEFLELWFLCNKIWFIKEDALAATICAAWHTFELNTLYTKLHRIWQ